MRKGRFSDEQIIAILKEHQAGISAADLCRKHGISDATFYTWRKKFGGMEVSEAKRLKALEAENARLKKLLAEQTLENAILKEVASGNFSARPHRRLDRRFNHCCSSSNRTATPWTVVQVNERML